MEGGTEKAIVVVDIPSDATAEQAEQILNAPCERGYYLDKLTFTWPGVGARAFFRKRTRRSSED